MKGGNNGIGGQGRDSVKGFEHEGGKADRCQGETSNTRDHFKIFVDK